MRWLHISFDSTWCLICGYVKKLTIKDILQFGYLTGVNAAGRPPVQHVLLHVCRYVEDNHLFVPVLE